MIKTQLISAEPIQKGDLLAVGLDGKVRVVFEPKTAGAEARPLVQEQTDVVENSPAQSYFIGMNPVKGTRQKAMASAIAPNGNYAVAFTADGNYQVSLFASNGNLIHKNTLGVASDDAEVAIVATEENTFAVVTKLGTTGDVQFVTIDEDGKSATGTVFPETTTSSSLGLAMLNDGNFVIAYALDDERHDVRCAIVNVEAEVVFSRPVDFFSKPGTNKQSVAVVALVGDGFVVVYSGIDDVTGRVFYKLFDNAGDNSITKKQSGEDIHLAEDYPFVGAVALVGGGFAAYNYGGIGPGYQLTIHNAEGENLGGNIILDAYDQENVPNRMALAALNNGNVAVVWAGHAAFGSVYTPAGRVLFSRANYGKVRGSVAVAASDDGAVVAFQGLNPEDNSLQLYAGHVGPLMYGEVGMTTIEAADRASAIVIGHVSNTLPYEGAKSLFAGCNVDNDMVQLDTLVSYTIPAQSVIGVADSDAEMDAPVEVVIEGEVELRVPFKLPLALDARYDGEIAGQRLAIVGNKAILKGIQ